MASSPQEWYASLPPVCKTWGTICFATTVAVQLRLLNPVLIYLDFSKAVFQFQVWRLLTNFFFLGPFSFRFAMDLLMLVRYGVILESNTFAGRTADFLYMVLMGMGVMLAAAAALPFFSIYFLSSPLVFMLLYLWSREQPTANVSIMGFVTVPAIYLPWVYLGMGVVMGGNGAADLLGILAGHTYYFLAVLYPQTGGPNLVQTPVWVHRVVAQWQAAVPQVVPPQQVPQRAPDVAAAYERRPGGTFQGRGYRLDRD